MIAKLDFDALKIELQLIRTNEAENGPKIRNSQPQLKIYCFVIKTSVT